MADDKELEKKETELESKEEVKEETQSEEKAEEAKVEAEEETEAEEVVEEALEVKVEDEALEASPKAEKKAAIGGPKSKKKKTASTFEDEVVEEEEEDLAEEAEEVKNTKAEVEAKIRKQIEKKQEKEARLGVYRLTEYLKEEHQWENWLFLAISIITLLLGCLMLNGALQVRSDFPLIGEYPTVFAWILVVLASVGLIYALYPFLKPAFPELKKITWLTGHKFLGNAIRTFVFIIIFTLLFVLYDIFLTQALAPVLYK